MEPDRTLPPRPSIRQAADYFGVDPRTVRRWIADGRLGAVRIGSRLIRLDREQLLKFGGGVGGPQ